MQAQAPVWHRVGHASHQNFVRNLRGHDYALAMGAEAGATVEAPVDPATQRLVAREVQHVVQIGRNQGSAVKWVTARASGSGLG